MKPAQFAHRPAPKPEPKPPKGARLRKCSNRACRAPFAPDAAHPFVMWCSPDCGATVALERIAKAKLAKEKAERAKDRAKKDGMSTRSDHIKLAQKAFNAFVRARDANQPCICCGQPLGEQRFGGSFDAGHYLSRGSAPHLRFEESNVHAQRKNCNRPGGTTAVAFRRGMVARIGLAAVEALEADQAPRKWTIDELKAITAKYRAKLKELG